jgi:hypothetical protein
LKHSCNLLSNALTKLSSSRLTCAVRTWWLSAFTHSLTHSTEALPSFRRSFFSTLMHLQSRSTVTYSTYFLCVGPTCTPVGDPISCGRKLLLVLFPTSWSHHG